MDREDDRRPRVRATPTLRSWMSRLPIGQLDDGSNLLGVGAHGAPSPPDEQPSAGARPVSPAGAKYDDEDEKQPEDEQRLGQHLLDRVG